jgi:hypothetical protein
LADLANDDKVVHGSASERSEDIGPRRSERALRIAESIEERRPGIGGSSIADAMISSENAMCVRLDERHIHRFNHWRLSLQDNLGKAGENIHHSGLE